MTQPETWKPKRLKHMQEELDKELARPRAQWNHTWITTQRICIDMTEQVFADVAPVLEKAWQASLPPLSMVDGITTRRELRDALATLEE